MASSLATGAGPLVLAVATFASVRSANRAARGRARAAGRPEAAARVLPAAGHADALSAVKDGDAITIDVLYSDHEGGQLAVSRFLVQRGSPDRPWLATDARHWNVGRIRASPAAL